MKIIVREKAAADLDALFEWIAQDNPLAATNMVARIVERINLLAATGLAHMGRAGLVRGTRELVEPPYIIVYEVDEDRDEIVVLSIVHGARKR
jgi:toxin ParE1/3/4